MKRKHTSLKDLAKELGVSISTISRGLKNHPDISPKLAEQIQKLAEQKKYSPNPQAVGLLRHESKTIGVIVPDLVTYFYSSVISGIEKFAKERGYFIVITTSNEEFENEKKCVTELVNLRVDGLIVCLAQNTVNYSHFDVLIEEEIPLVFFDRVCRTSEVSSVVADNIEAACAITLHFFNSGKRNIAHIAGPKELNITQERIAGYLDGLKECGLKFRNEYLVYSDLSLESAALATRKLIDLPNRPDAIFGVNDTVAFSAMKEIKKANLNIPNDIALVGFTDEFHATVVEPSLTSVMHPTFEMGNEACRLLIEQIESPLPFTPRQVVMKTKLVVRESSVRT